MSNNVLVTDSLFIKDKHVKMLEDAGYEVERLDKPKASEEELIEAVKGKVGYILGGIEHITEPVIAAADELKAIAFTGIAFKDYIPAWDAATKRGIAISHTPDSPTQTVAEWAIAAALMMNRGLLELGGPGSDKFMTTKGLNGQTVGIIGFGRIGQRVAAMLQPFNPHNVLYYNRSAKTEAEARLHAQKLDLEELLTRSDIIFMCLPTDAGKDLISARELALLQDNALIVSISHHGLVNPDALYDEVKSGRLRGAFDNSPSDKFADLPLSHWYASNESAAFNTESEIELTSNTAVKSLINLLKTGEDQYLGNPQFRESK
jgi:glyoxylate reductase